MNTILIIDDDPRNIFALVAVLKTKKFVCLTASSAEEGIKILSQQPNIGIILMDMMMPDMDGYQAIAEIRKNELVNKIPIVAVTAQAMVGDREKCIAAGADDYISKPIDVDILTELLGHYLNT